MVKHGVVSLVLPDLDGMVRIHRMVRIRCKSGVCIKILESGFRNQDPQAFALSLVWFADPDHVRIRNQLHFAFRWVFYGSGPEDSDPGSRLSQQLKKQILTWYFLKKLGSAPTFLWISSCFLQFSFKKILYAVWGLRRRSGPKSGSARPPSHRYHKKAQYRTLTDYGPGICIRARIPYRTIRIRILILLWHIKIKLLGGRIRVQYSDPDLPALARVIRASHSNDVRCPWWRGQSRKTTTGLKSCLKIKISLKIKILPPQVHR